MNPYEEKKQARIDRYRENADKARAESSELYGEYKDRMSAIPLGQPMMPDHHSYKSDVNYRNKAHKKLENSWKASEKAAHYEAKANAAEANTAISSDDPEALQKLNEKLKSLETWQSEMKALNAYYRKHQTCVGYPGMSEETAKKYDDRIDKDYSFNKQPAPSYALTNNNAEIRRLKQRIAILEKSENTGYVGWKFDGGEVVANKEENRLQVLFDEKPDEEKRTQLKKNGFRWSPKNLAWQRQLNDNAIFTAGYVECIKPLCGRKPRELQPKSPPAKQKNQPER